MSNRRATTAIFAAVLLVAAILLDTKPATASFTTSSSTMQPPNMQAPARGFDTWSGYARNFSEETIFKTAAWITKNLNNNQTTGATSNYRYFILDEGWQHTANMNTWVLNHNGIPIPDPVRFPSTQGGAGFKTVSEKLRALYGLDLGLWIIKGITAQAVELNLPLPEPNPQKYTAKDIIFSDGRSCSWHKDVFAINMSHPGAQTFYNAMMRLYASWGVAYLKVDCIFGANYDLPAIEGIHRALAQENLNAVWGVPPVLSLSPGTNASVAQAEEAGGCVNSYRITDDLYDCWTQKQEEKYYWKAGKCVMYASWRGTAFQSLIGSTKTSKWLDKRPSFPDSDMIPLGRDALQENNYSLLEYPNLVRFVLARWSIAQSPVILTGKIDTIPTTTASHGDGTKEPASPSTIPAILANQNIARMHQHVVAPRSLWWDDILNTSSSSDVAGTGAWIGRSPDVEGGLYLALFAFSEALPPSPSPASVRTTVSFEVMAAAGYPPSPEMLEYDLLDLFADHYVTSMKPQAACRCIELEVPLNDVKALLLTPGAYKPLPPKKM